MMIKSEPKPTILIVDDNEINKNLLTEYLSGNYNLLTASNGVEAMDLIEEKLDEISLVLLDIVMPHLNGFEMLDEMNKNGWIETLPVVIISSEGYADFKNKAYLYNVYNFITKPFTYEEVMACVERILDCTPKKLPQDPA